MADFVQTLPHELTTALSTLSLTGPALTNAVLFNRDLFLHITRFCELGALGALSATCKALEESVLDRQTWWHHCERLWPQPSLRPCRDPRGLCRRLKEANTWGECKLRSLHDLLLLIQIVKPDDEVLTYEFNVGDLAKRYPGNPTDSGLVLPGLPKLRQLTSEALGSYVAERVDVRLLRKDTFQILGGQPDDVYDVEFGGNFNVILGQWQVQGLRHFAADTQMGPGYPTGNPDAPLNIEVRTTLLFEGVVEEGPPFGPSDHLGFDGWMVTMDNEVWAARDVDPAITPDYQYMERAPQAVPWSLDTLNRIYHVRWWTETDDWRHRHERD